MKKLIITALLVTTVQFAQAENFAKIGDYEQSQIDTAKTDKLLNSSYQSTLKNIRPSNGDFQRIAFKQSQRDWLKYRKSQCSLESGIYAPVLSDEEFIDNENCIQKFNIERITFFKSDYLR